MTARRWVLGSDRTLAAVAAMLNAHGIPAAQTRDALCIEAGQTTGQRRMIDIGSCRSQLVG